MPRSVRCRPWSLVLVAALVAAPFVLASGAAADCSLPTIQVEPSEGPGGATVTVTGDAFATQCNDVNPPPGPHGVGGPPQTGVELVLTDATGTATTLATVDADDEYAFLADVVVPPDAAVGAARIEAVSQPGTVSAPSVEFTVTGEVIPATPAFTG